MNRVHIDHKFTPEITDGLDTLQSFRSKEIIKHFE
jgi:hypothetical protein